MQKILLALTATTNYTFLTMWIKDSAFRTFLDYPHVREANFIPRAVFGISLSLPDFGAIFIVAFMMVRNAIIIVVIIIIIMMMFFLYLIERLATQESTTYVWNDEKDVLGKSPKILSEPLPI